MALAVPPSRFTHAAREKPVRTGKKSLQTGGTGRESQKIHAGPGSETKWEIPPETGRLIFERIGGNKSFRNSPRQCSVKEAEPGNQNRIMALEDQTTIDMISKPDADGKICLVITDAGVTTDPDARFDLLAKKLQAYSHAVLNGDLAMDYPDKQPQDFFIRVVCANPPTDAMKNISSVGQSENPMPVVFETWNPPDADASEETPSSAIPPEIEQTPPQHSFPWRPSLLIALSVAVCASILGYQIYRSHNPVKLTRSIKFSTTGNSSGNGGAWENSLGMKFVAVPGTKVMFCIWDVRVRDYRAYSQANGGVSGGWDNLSYQGVQVSPSEDCPVARVNWNDAKGFCAWLTQKERAEGKINNSQSYRLPTKAEWQQAAGHGKYPWGDAWPPPPGSGNFADATAKQSFGDLMVIGGYDDGYAATSPVGSFKANIYGLYDMGGNVSQWCEDWYENHVDRVMRGSSWRDGLASALSSSHLIHHLPTSRDDTFGFRIVLEDASSDLGVDPEN